jgi:hypothetical protein
MAAGASYPVDIADAASGIVKSSGTLVYTDSTKQPSQNGNAIASGTLPNTGAWVSGTAKVNPVARNVETTIEVVSDATNNIASVTIAVSPDNVTYTTVATPNVAAALNNLGTISLDVVVKWPQGWFIKLTIGAHATVAASIYY